MVTSSSQRNEARCEIGSDEEITTTAAKDSNSVAVARVDVEQPFRAVAPLRCEGGIAKVPWCLCRWTVEG